jgi:ABC-type uncharacterized transport system ATPase subunit
MIAEAYNTSNVGDIAVYNGSNWNTVSTQGTVQASLSDKLEPATLELNEDSTLKVGDITVTGKQFSSMLKVLFELAKEDYPEDFI